MFTLRLHVYYAQQQQRYAVADEHTEVTGYQNMYVQCYTTVTGYQNPDASAT